MLKGMALEREGGREGGPKGKRRVGIILSEMPFAKKGRKEGREGKRRGGRNKNEGLRGEHETREGRDTNEGQKDTMQ